MRPDSAIDVPMDFDGPARFDGYFHLKDYLGGLPCGPVDLVTSRGIKSGHGSMLIGTGSLSRSGLLCLVELMASAAKVGRLTCG